MEKFSGNKQALNFLGSAVAALRFLTILPVSWKVDQDGENLKRCLIWFPAVGLMIGLFVCCLALFFSSFLPSSMVSLLVVFLLSGVSGFLHVDGVADTVDGFLSARPREDILEIMKDSRIGPMGVTALLFLFWAKFVALSSMNIDDLCFAAILIPVAGRVAIIMQITVLSYARTSPGLGSLFDLSHIKRTCLISLLVFIALSVWCFPTRSLLLVVVFFLVSMVFKMWCERKIGGYTGDTLGASCEIMELAMAITLCNTIL